MKLLAAVAGALTFAFAFAFALSAPAAWATTATIRVSPGVAHPGALVTVHGSVDHGCQTPGAVTIFSHAFAGATPHDFAGVPSVSALARKDGVFSRTIRLRPTVRTGSYSIGGRCGGGNLGSVTLRVTRPAPVDAMGATAQARLRRATALWAAQHLHNYSMRVTVSCFCSPEPRRPTTITVRGGRPHGSKYFANELQTIPEMFRLIRRALADPDAGPTTVTFDPHRGFPRTVAIDPLKNAVDDELSWTVDRFRAS
jgi:hypothetical protein